MTAQRPWEALKMKCKNRRERKMLYVRKSGMLVLICWYQIHVACPANLRAIDLNYKLKLYC